MAEQTPIARPHSDELHDAVVQALNGPLVAKLAHLLLDELRQQLGGRRVYIAIRGQRAQAINPERDEAVLRMFNGRNHREVVKHFSISRRTLYRILAGKTTRK
jgi:Mor family transcriptional regulator